MNAQESSLSSVPVFITFVGHIRRPDAPSSCSPSTLRHTQMQHKGLIRGLSLTITYEYFTDDEILIWACLFFVFHLTALLTFPYHLSVCNASL